LKVKERAPTTLDEALRIARLEAWAKSTAMTRQDEDRVDRTRQKIRSTKPDGHKAPADFNDRFAGIESEVAKMTTNMDRRYEELKQLIMQNNQPKPSTDKNSTEAPASSGPAASCPKSETQTFNSAGEGPRPTNMQTGRNMRPATYQAPQRPQSQIFLCWNCGMPGHLQRNCPMNRGQRPVGNAANRGSKKMQDKANVYVRMTLMGKDIPCLVDSGCEIKLVPKALTERFKDIEISPTSTTQVWAANNSPIRIYGETNLPFFLGDHCLWTSALVSEDVEEVMLGSDWLRDYGCVWDFGTGNLCIDGRLAVTLTRRGHIKCRRVLVQEVKEIPPRSQVDVKACVTVLSIREPTEDVIVETCQLKPGLYVGRTLLPADHHDQKVCVAIRPVGLN